MRRLAVVALLPAAALALTACAGKSEPVATAAPSPSTVVSSPSAAPPSPSAAPSPTAPTVDQTITITYADGKVTGVTSPVKVKLNSRVALVVTSDVADEVHVHTYDKSAEVAKGGTVTVVFKATIPGRIEVELENLKRRLVLLQIQ